MPGHWLSHSLYVAGFRCFRPGFACHFRAQAAWGICAGPQAPRRASAGIIRRRAGRRFASGSLISRPAAILGLGSGVRAPGIGHRGTGLPGTGPGASPGPGHRRRGIRPVGRTGASAPPRSDSRHHRLGTGHSASSHSLNWLSRHSITGIWLLPGAAGRHWPRHWAARHLAGAWAGQAGRRAAGFGMALRAGHAGRRVCPAWLSGLQRSPAGIIYWLHPSPGIGPGGVWEFARSTDSTGLGLATFHDFRFPFAGFALLFIAICWLYITNGSCIRGRIGPLGLARVSWASGRAGRAGRV